MDQSLIQMYKQTVYEKIFTDFIIAKSDINFEKFETFWKSGLGLFKIKDGKIDIRL
jgi:hypothetical protein